MIISGDKVADVDQSQIEMKIVGKSQRPVGHGDSLYVEEIEIFGNTYRRIPNHGNVTWEDENGNRLDRNTEPGQSRTELETALECAYREKYFATEKTIDGT